MKKIITFVLVLSLGLTGIFGMVSCKDTPPEADHFAEVAEMFNESQPTKVVATTSQKFGEHELKGAYSLIVGAVDGKEAAIYTAEYDVLRDITSGSGEVVKGAFDTESVVKEYIQGKGVRTNKKGKWDATAASIVPARGSIALNISKDIASADVPYTYENNKLSFTVAADKTAQLLGEGNGVSSPVAVEVMTDGAFVIGVNLAYTVPADTANSIPETTVTISVVYSYDFEAITIG